MSKRIKTPEQAIEYLKKVLEWKAFCESHRNVKDSIQIVIDCHETPKRRSKRRKK